MRRALLTLVLAATCSVVAAQGPQFRAVPRVPFPPHQQFTGALAAADVDGDGDVDLFSGNAGLAYWQNRLALNDGRGGFHDVSYAQLPVDRRRCRAAAFADVDGDGDPDLVLANDGDPNDLWINDGAGVFRAESSTRLPGSSDPSHSVALGDVDGDLDQDIVFGNEDGDHKLYLNDGNGLFSDASSARLPGTGAFAKAVVLADCDDDDDLDLWIANAGGAQPQLYLNDGAGVFSDATPSRLPALVLAANALAVGDVDGDGDPDAYFGDGVARDRLLVNHGGVFADETTVRLPDVTRSTFAAVMADVDLDGDLDVAVGHSTPGATQEIALYLNDGQGSFTDATSARMPATGINAHALACVDLDVDGDPDLAFGSDGGENGAYFNHHRQVAATEAMVLGRSFRLDVFGAPGYASGLDTGFPHLSAQLAAPPIQLPWGELHLAPPFFALGAVPLPAPSGSGSLTLSIPLVPQVAGLPLHLQGIHTSTAPGAAPISFTNVLCEPLVNLPDTVLALPNGIAALQQQHCPEASVSFWAESVADGAVSVLADEAWPTASAVKVFILVAAYRQFQDVWHTTPPELADILNASPGYQAPLAVFSAATRATISSHLSGDTYAELAAGMMAKIVLPNAPYNACASILTFLLGGPAGTTAAIHTIDAELDSVRVGRYMLEARSLANDNVNSVRDFGTILGMIARDGVPGLTPADHVAIRGAMTNALFNGLPQYRKLGGLSSYPMVSSEAGFVMRGNNALVYALNIVAFRGSSREGRTQMVNSIKQQLLLAPGGQ